MKRFFEKPRITITSAIEMILIIGLLDSCQTQTQSLAQPIITVSQWTTTPTRPPKCKPIPTEPPIVDPATPTPNILTPVQHPAYTDQPTRTPYPIAHTYDLAPDLPPEDKGIALVFRCNGEEDQYLIGPMPYVDFLKAIKLREGDVLLGVASPASLMGHEPPFLIPSLIASPNSTPTPYP